MLQIQSESQRYIHATGEFAAVLPDRRIESLTRLIIGTAHSLTDRVAAW
jgi:hypothetical protein